MIISKKLLFMVALSIVEPGIVARGSDEEEYEYDDGIYAYDDNYDDDSEYYYYYYYSGEGDDAYYYSEVYYYYYGDDPNSGDGTYAYTYDNSGEGTYGYAYDPNSGDGTYAYTYDPDSGDGTYAYDPNSGDGAYASDALPSKWPTFDSGSKINGDDGIGYSGDEPKADVEGAVEGSPYSPLVKGGGLHGDDAGVSNVFPYGMGPCPATCLAVENSRMGTCDIWVLQGFDCSSLESNSGCDCSGCSRCQMSARHSENEKTSLLSDPATLLSIGAVVTVLLGVGGLVVWGLKRQAEFEAAAGIRPNSGAHKPLSTEDEEGDDGRNNNNGEMEMQPFVSVDGEDADDDPEDSYFVTGTVISSAST